MDGSKNATRALDAGIKMSKTYGAELFILNVIPTPSILLAAQAGLGVPPVGAESYYEQEEIDSRHFLEEGVELAKAQKVTNVSSEAIRATSSIVEEIIDTAARKNIDLIVIGTRGVGGFKKLLQGSVSSGVVIHAECNVMVVR